MEDQYLQKLAHKWKTGTLSVQERIELDNWYNAYNDEFLELPEEFKDKLALIERRISEGVISKVLAQEKVNSPFTVHLWKPAMAIVAMVTGVAFCIWLYNSYANTERTDANTFSNYSSDDIQPGQKSATLTLANGQKIKLTETTRGELAKEAGVTITKSAEGELVYEIVQPYAIDVKSGTGMMNTLSTAKGETYQLKLPDGSKVWLNAASTLTYSAGLSDRQIRKVRLVGEAYFEVSKDKTRPFVVEIAGHEVLVLGTKFNVNGYAGEAAVKTTLLEGSVRVNAGIAGQKTIKPGEQAIVGPSLITVTPADLEEALAWKNDLFVFKSEELRSVMRKLSRWYNVEVEYKGHISSKYFTGKISRYKNISEVLEILKLTESINFKIEVAAGDIHERRIIIMP